MGDVVLTYRGYYVPHGLGTKTFCNGDVYYGNFKYGCFSGWGHYKALNGDYYEGNYRNGIPNGVGESYQAVTQRHYRGGFRMGLENGFAVITRSDDKIDGRAKRYEGEVQNGKRHGLGKLYFTEPNGHMVWFEGMWHNDLLHGYAAQTSTTGEWFAGNFVNGYLEGMGTCRAKDGKIYNVIFTNGVVSQWLNSSQSSIPVVNKRPETTISPFRFGVSRPPPTPIDAVISSEDVLLLQWAYCHNDELDFMSILCKLLSIHYSKSVYSRVLRSTMLCWCASDLGGPFEEQKSIHYANGIHELGRRVLDPAILDDSDVFSAFFLAHVARPSSWSNTFMNHFRGILKQVSARKTFSEVLTWYGPFALDAAEFDYRKYGTRILGKRRASRVDWNDVANMLRYGRFSKLITAYSQSTLDFLAFYEDANIEDADIDGCLNIGNNFAE